MKIIFSEYARQELYEAADYLELEFEGLGDRFKSEVKSAAERIAGHPKAWSVERGDVRKCLLHKFLISCSILSKRIIYSLSL